MKDIQNKLILGAMIGIAVVIGLLLWADVRELGSYIVEFPLLSLIPIVSLTLFNYLGRWLKWQYYLNLIGVRGFPARDSAVLWVSGFVLALSPGKVAELLKSAMLKNMHGTPISQSAPIVIAERITDGLAMMVLAALGFGGILFLTPHNESTMWAYVPAYVSVLTILVAGIVVVQIRPLSMWALNLLGKLPLIRKYSHILSDLYESTYELFRPGPLAIAVGLGIVSWAGECFGFFLILRGMGVDPTLLLLAQATFILAFATIVGAVSGLPGGLGAAEATIAAMVPVIILRQGNRGFGGTASLLIRVFTLWFAVVLGLVVAFAFRKRLFPDKQADTGD